MMKVFLILVLLLFPSCKWITGDKKAPFAMLGIPDPEGTPVFKQGFAQGCKAVLGPRGTELFRDYFKYEFDTALIDNPEYQFGFARGWSNCFQHIVGGRHTLGGSADTYIYGGSWGLSFGMGKGNIDETVNYGNQWGNPFAGGSIDDIWSVTQKGRGGAAGSTADGPGTVFGGHPLWGTWQDSQIFGQ